MSSNQDNYAPARAAVEAMAVDAPEAAEAINHALALVDAGADVDAIRAAVDAAIPLICPIHGFARSDDPALQRNQRLLLYVEESFRLACLAPLAR